MVNQIMALKRSSLYLTIVQIVHLSALPSEVVGKT